MFCSRVLKHQTFGFGGHFVRLVTSWHQKLRHSTKQNTKLRHDTKVKLKCTSWHKKHHHDVTKFVMTSKLIMTSRFSSWCQKYAMMSKTCYDVKKFVMTSQSLYLSCIFAIMAYFLHHDELCGVIACFDVMTNFFWGHDVLLTSWRMLDVMTCPWLHDVCLRNDGLLDTMTYLWCHDELFDVMMNCLKLWWRFFMSWRTVWHDVYLTSW